MKEIKQTKNSSKERLAFPIIGMHCASCAKLIEKKLQKVPGVISASVNSHPKAPAFSFA